MKGYKHTEEHKQKIRDYRTGRKMSEETKRKISEALKGRPNKRKSIPISEEIKNKIRNAQMGLKNHNSGNLSSYNINDWSTQTCHELARTSYRKDKCEICCITIEEYRAKYKKINNLMMHNIDKDFRNLSKDNWITVCIQCHTNIHQRLGDRKVAEQSLT